MSDFVPCLATGPCRRIRNLSNSLGTDFDTHQAKKTKQIKIEQRLHLKLKVLPHTENHSLALPTTGTDHKPVNSVTENP